MPFLDASSELCRNNGRNSGISCRVSSYVTICPLTFNAQRGTLACASVTVSLDPKAPAGPNPVMAPRKKEARAWQRMLSGRRLDLLDPTPMDIEIADIAHGLAFQARWNGQTKGDFPYSVAEHSLLVEQLFARVDPKAPAKWLLAALLHDAPEYVIGDMISPVKAAVGPGYSALDDRLTAAIHLRFGLPAQIPKTVKTKIKRADRLSAWLEATQIAGFSIPEANKLFGRPNSSLIKGLSIVLRAPIETRHAFVDRHEALLAQL